MHRFYIAPENWNPDELVLREDEAHHARNVLRLKQGEKVVVFDGRGREITADIVDLSRNEVRLRKLHETETAPLRCRIALAQAIPKGKNMELIVQKAVEIGAMEIFPLISERTIVDLDSKDAAQKQAKWQTVAIEAAKQCGQNWLPVVHSPQKLKDFFENSVAAVYDRRGHAAREDFGTHRAPPQFDLRLIGSLQPGAMHLKKILADHAGEPRRQSVGQADSFPYSATAGVAPGKLSASPAEKGADRHLPTSVLMMVGPEGDFTPAEIALAKTHGCLPITLGPIILRVETAAIYCLSVLSYELL